MANFASGNLFGTFTVLRDYPNADAAMKLLRYLASLVKPIMQKHKWRVPVLTEFVENPESIPDDDGLLLGYNEGEGALIAIRLRQYWDVNAFYDLEELVGTLLHELVHNEISGHKEDFDQLLGVLEREYAVLRASGYNGEGFYFDGEGQRLGTGMSYHPDLTDIRRKAMSGENRLYPPIVRRPPALAPPTPAGPTKSKPKRLGGTKVSRGDRVRIAEAAEKRRQQSSNCGCDKPGERQTRENINKGMKNGIREKDDPISSEEMAVIMLQIRLMEEAEEERRMILLHAGSTPEDAIVIPGNNREATSRRRNAASSSFPPTPPPPPPNSTMSSRNVTTENQQRVIPPSSAARSSSSLPRGSGGGGNQHSHSDSRPIHPTTERSGRGSGGINAQWPCRACTFLNSPLFTHCDMCDTPRQF